MMNAPRGAVRHLSDAQAERLSEFDRKQLTTIDVTLLRGIVLSKARELANRTVQVSDVEDAFLAIFQPPNANELGMGSLTVKSYLVPFMLPSALLALAFSLLYRLRRIDLHRDVLTEPWVVTMPNSIVEKTGVLVWLIALLLL